MITLWCTFHRIPFVEQSSSPILIRSVLCDGTESNITTCLYSLVTSVDSTVSHGQDAFVVCRPSAQQNYSGVYSKSITKINAMYVLM